MQKIIDFLEKLDEKKMIHSILIIGQSNMGGEGLKMKYLP